jgi:predicted dithiol-disulfide oxidoreductase (DUF899 family)
VHLRDLFTAPDRPLIVYHLMYGKQQTDPCPMCTQWIDGFNGIAPHLAQNADLVIVAAADPPALRDHARRRGWDRLRLLSAGDSTFKYDLGSEDADGAQDSTVSVFGRDAGGKRAPRTVRARMADDIQQRHRPALRDVAPARPDPAGTREWYCRFRTGQRWRALQLISTA